MAGYADLVDPARRRHADRQRDVFVVEGTRAIRQLLDDGWPLESVLLSTARAAARPDLVRDALASGAAAYAAGQDVFDRIAGFHAHRGALALARRPTERTVESVAAGCSLVLVVEGVNDHENLGALFRNAAAFGVGAVVLDPSAADPLYRRSVRVSVGHVLRVPFARAQRWPGDVVGLKALGFRVVALTPAGEATIGEVAGAPAGEAAVAAGPAAALEGAAGSVDVRSAVSGAAVAVGGEVRGAVSRAAAPAAGGEVRWAVMVGAEGDGLSPAALEAADVRARIPMAGGVDSLNVATAAAVALHRLSGL